MSLPTPPKGSLEDLFRHHLLESEAAASMPRPHVWEQLDNSLLLAQNEQYRRRLRVHRWAVAASLLLAMLAGGGWWQSQQLAGRRSASLAQAPAAAGAASPAALGVRAYYPAAPAGTTGVAAGYGLASLGTAAPSTTDFSLFTEPTIDQTATSLSGKESALASVRSAASRQGAASAAGAGFGEVDYLAGARTQTDREPRAFAYTTTGRAATGRAAGRRLLGIGAALGTEANYEGQLASVISATAAEEPLATVASAAQPEAVAGSLATRLVPLAVAGRAGLPSRLGELPLPERPLPTLARRWQFGTDYAASSFQPNIDFAKQATAYNAALGSSSAFVTRNAATEYRENLRPGLGQRLGLWAMRRLGNGRFGLRMGLEVAQNRAYSASSVAFVGEQVADFNYLTYAAPSNAVVVPRLQNTSYRYRTVSVPVELRYGNPAKAGFSLYGRLGGLLTALLNVRSDVDGNAEATRTYSLASGGSPYRHLSANLRGGVGVHYQPLNHQWGLNLGPVAEAGILSLNADPVQDFWSQKRAYSFGLEAGVELGRALRIP